jgi:hypothetical protein
MAGMFAAVSADEEVGLAVGRDGVLGGNERAQQGDGPAALMYCNRTIWVSIWSPGWSGSMSRPTMVRTGC